MRDLENIRNTISLDDEQAALNVVGRLVHSFELLAAKPDIGRPMPGRATREWKVPGLPYVIPYRFDGMVIILRVYHTRRMRPKQWR